MTLIDIQIYGYIQVPKSNKQTKTYSLKSVCYSEMETIFKWWN